MNASTESFQPNELSLVSSPKSTSLNSSDSSGISSANRYNLRNRGPAVFASLAEQECPICLAEVYDKPVVVNCGHTFCGKCIGQSLSKFKNCPICNQVLIKSLFLCDTSYTKRLTMKARSPMRQKIRTMDKCTDVACNTARRITDPQKVTEKLTISDRKVSRKRVNSESAVKDLRKTRHQC